MVRGGAGFWIGVAIKCGCGATKQHNLSITGAAPPLAAGGCGVASSTGRAAAAAWGLLGPGAGAGAGAAGHWGVAVAGQGRMREMLASSAKQELGELQLGGSKAP